MEGLGNVQGPNRAYQTITLCLPPHETAVEEHPHGLDRVEGNPFRAAEDP